LYITTSGIIYCNETWSGNIQITGDILVSDGVTLTILPGTNILIDTQKDGNNMYSGCDERCDERFDCSQVPCSKWMNPPFDLCEENMISIHVKGRLIVKETSDNRIYIHSNSNDPRPWDWMGMTISDG